MIDRNLPYVKRLSEEDRRELEKQVLVFVSEKHFEGCGGLVLTDAIKVTVAAQACLLTLRNDADYFPNLKSILIYPDTYIPKTPSISPDWWDTRKRGPRLGESWRNGVVVLSWNSVLGGAANIEDGRNVVLHEFAHQLDQEDGGAVGIPILPSPSAFRTWARVLQSHFDEHRRNVAKGRARVLDEYGATNPAEFFAVATECFFEKAKQLRARHPELYSVLKEYYGQDPASR